MKIKKHLKKIIFIGIPILLILALGIYIAIQNNNLEVTEIEFNNENIPSRFDDVIICHVSDLHDAQFGENQQELFDTIYAGTPDIIVITGDLIDRRRYDLESSMEFIENAIRIAPIFYVSGNHEAWSGEYEEIKKALTDAGVIVLDNETISISIGSDDYIDMLGLSDPGFSTEVDSEEYDTAEIESLLEEWSKSDRFKILLSHRPEIFDIYVEHEIDLVFAGHAHGGQIRLPIVGGVLAPNQGFFPEYTSGLYTKEETSMYVSRGLGNSIFPIRVFNNPEIIFMTLKGE